MIFLVILFLATVASADPPISVIGGSDGDGYPSEVAKVLPVGMDWASDGALLVTDTRESRIARRSPVNSHMSTVAGNKTTGFSGDGGPATSAQFWLGGGADIAVIGDDLYISDSFNGRVRKVNSSGVVSTVIAGLNFPSGLTKVSSDNLLVVEGNGHKVHRYIPSTGVTTLVAGTTVGFGGDGGPATSANLASPTEALQDASGNIYICDKNNNRIRKVNTSGIITTIAGNGIGQSQGDGGPATAAAINFPSSIVLKENRYLLIAEYSGVRVRQVDLVTGLISTLITPATLQRFKGPVWLLLSTDEQWLYMSDIQIGDVRKQLLGAPPSLTPVISTLTPTNMPTETRTRSPTHTASATPTESLTPTWTPTATWTSTPMPTPTVTPTVTPIPTQVPSTFTFTPTRTHTRTLTPTFTSTPTQTPTSTVVLNIQGQVNFYLNSNNPVSDVSVPLNCE